MSPQKRLLLAIVFVLVAIGLAVGIYFVFFRSVVVPTFTKPTPSGAPVSGLPSSITGAPETPAGAPGAPGTLPTIPTIAQGGATQTTAITDHQAIGVTAIAGGSSVAYYDPADSRFYKVNADGSVSKISNQQFFDVQHVTWAAGAQKAVLEYPDGSNIFYDFNKNAQVSLPKQWDSFDFSKDGSQIAAKSIGTDPNNRWLITANPDGSNARAIEPLGENADKVTVSWSPTREAIAFSATGDTQGLDAVSMLVIGQNHENFKALNVDGRDFRPQWTPDGTQLLYSVYSSNNAYKPTLWLSGARGDEIGADRQKIGLDTWADKCTFSDAHTVYCAVPTDLPDNYGLQPTLADTIPDQVYRVDLSTGNKTLIGAPAENSSMKQLVVSGDGSKLFYTEAQSGVLREMRLK